MELLKLATSYLSCDKPTFCSPLNRPRLAAVTYAHGRKAESEDHAAPPCRYSNPYSFPAFSHVILRRTRTSRRPRSASITLRESGQMPSGCG